MTDRRILALRCLLVLSICLPLELGCLATDHWWMALAVTVPLLFMPVFAVVIPCGVCTGGLPSSIQIVISGVGNGTCSNCGLMNGTHISDTPADIGAVCSCLIQKSGDVACPGEVNTFIAGNYIWNTTLMSFGLAGSHVGGDSSVSWRTGSLGSNYVCIQNVSGMPHFFSDIGCDGSGATVDVTM